MNASAVVHLVLLSLEPWDEVWRRNQYLVDGLLRDDPLLEVLFIEPAADPTFELVSRRRPRRGKGLRLAPGYDGRLVLYQPTKVLPRFVGPFAEQMLRANGRRAIGRLGWTSGVLWINDLGWSRFIRDTGWPSLYDITDDWVQADRGEREHRRLSDADARLLELCNEVIVCSRGLELTKGRVRPVHLIPNGVDVDRYRQNLSRPGDLPQAPVALYVGTLHEDRLDVELALLTATAVGAVGGAIALVGPNALSVTNSQKLAAHPHVALLGPRAHDQVPAYLQHSHVLIVPHVVDNFTESLDPLKLYEYLAVGRPIVSTDVAGFRDEPSAIIAGGQGFAVAVTATLNEWLPTMIHPNVPTWADRVKSVRVVVDSLADVPGGDSS
jgi:teichuronic acid biosynthesis glycosyltransferase TuaH